MASQLESFRGGFRDLFLRVMRQRRSRYLGGVVVALAVHVAMTQDVGAALGVAAAIALVVVWACQLDVSNPPYAANLPGVGQGPRKPVRFDARKQQRAAKVGLLLVMGTSVLLLPEPIVLAVAVATLVPGSVSMLVAGRREWLVRRLIRALRAYAPTIAIPYAGYSGGPVQISMWEPYLLESEQRGVIFNWRPEHFSRNLEGAQPTWPMVQLDGNRQADIPRLLVPSLKALFYIHNATQNKRYLRHRTMTHVWLGHGDSDKPASYLERQADYDWLVMAGQAAIDRYAAHDIAVPADKFIILGRPQTSDIRPALTAVGEVERPTVLYAPTWQGKTEAVNFSSLERGVDLIEALIARNVRVIFRPHPLSYRWRIRREVVELIQEVLAGDPNGDHVWGPQADTGWGIVECANASDAMISDVSSVVSDYLQSGKPYAMVNMRDSLADFRAGYPVAQSGYVIRADLGNLDATLDDMLGPDPLKAVRDERRRYVLGGFEGRESADAFAAFVRKLAAD